MPPQVVIDDDYVTLVYDAESGIVHHEFHRFVSGERFRGALQQGCELLKQNHGTKWLSDDRGNSALTPDDALWGETVWFPAVVEAGWKHWAVVMPERLVGQMNLMVWVERYREQGINARVFVSPDAAMEWLKAQ